MSTGPDPAERRTALRGKGQPARHKTGLDANRPIDPRSGQIEPHVVDPDVVASTGTGWVRLNFILGPWSSPLDDTLFEGRTWAQTYSQIISGFREKEVKLYGLIGVEAMPTGPDDRFRLPPPRGNVDDDWLDRYVAHFLAIVEMFHEEVQILESFNEPDDWHGQDRNWVHPGWFAILLQRLYTAVRSKPELDRVKIVSGPLQGLESNQNAAVHYLRNTYRAGKEWFGWGQPGKPVPFDGVGYHIYVKSSFTPDQAQQEQAIRTICRSYLDAMHQVVRQEEGQDRPLYVSEMGWNSRVDRWEIQRREQFQAGCLRAALHTVCSDPLVDLGVWFCTQDFRTEAQEMYFGLYRPGKPAPETRKPAFDAFRAFCEGVIEEEEGEEEEKQYTNQQVINAFYSAAAALGLADRWSLLKRAGLDLNRLAANRSRIYDGKPIRQLPNLTAAEKALVQAKLDAQLPRGRTAAMESAPGGEPISGTIAFDEAPDADFGLDLSIALQEDLLRKLERNNQLLTRTLEGLAGSGDSAAGMDPILWKVGILAGLVAVVVSVVSTLLLHLLVP